MQVGIILSIGKASDTTEYSSIGISEYYYSFTYFNDH